VDPKTGEDEERVTRLSHCQLERNTQSRSKRRHSILGVRLENAGDWKEGLTRKLVGLGQLRHMTKLSNDLRSSKEHIFYILDIFSLDVSIF